MTRSPRAARRVRPAVALAVALMLAMAFSSLTVASAAGGKITKLSTDPYTNSTSQHKTEVEPDNFAFGSTIVHTFQVGRFFDGGSSNIGWATSTDNGKTWKHGFLPGTTVYATPKGTYDRISDPAVAYDAAHKTWLISGLAILGTDGAGVLVNRSADGVKWTNPVTVAANGGSQFFDKEWVVCDDTASSHFYGHCYVEFDNNSLGNLVQMSTSADGGKTWSKPIATKDSTHGLGGQPLVQPNGTVVVPYEGNEIDAFTSTDGGKSWGNSVAIGSANSANDPGGIRSGPLPSAEIDGAGNVYVAWENCQFENGCSANDIVYSTSKDGKKWSATMRVPINAKNSGADYLLPGIGVEKSTSGSSAHIGIVYYFYPKVNCSGSACKLEVGFISSTNAGKSWSKAIQLAGPMQTTWLANTNQGFMVGDYMSAEVINGKAWPVFMVATAPTKKVFHESAYTATGGIPVAGGTVAVTDSAVFAGGYTPARHMTLTAY